MARRGLSRPLTIQGLIDEGILESLRALAVLTEVEHLVLLLVLQLDGSVGLVVSSFELRMDAILLLLQKCILKGECLRIGRILLVNDSVLILDLLGLND